MRDRSSAWVMIFVLALAGVIGYRFFASQNAPGSGARPLVGRLAPELEGEDVDGKPFRLSDYRGKVVALDFWGFW
jgi:hypothetical protein